MNIHRHLVMAVSAAIPEGHLLHTSSTFLFYLLHAPQLLPKAVVCPCHGMQT